MGDLERHTRNADSVSFPTGSFRNTGIKTRQGQINGPEGALRRLCGQARREMAEFAQGRVWPHGKGMMEKEGLAGQAVTNTHALLVWIFIIHLLC